MRERNLKILVIGATSGIGLCTVEQANSRGHSVRAMARGASDLQLNGALLERFPGDALDPNTVGRAIDGMDAIIMALGIRERPAMIWEDETLFSEATRVLMDAMEAAGMRRLLAITGFGAGRSREAMSRIERLGHGAVLGRVYADKTRQEALIEKSELDWTIVRPVILTNGAKTGRVKVLTDPGTWRNGLVSRADVACYLLDAVENALNIREDVVIARAPA